MPLLPKRPQRFAPLCRPPLLVLALVALLAGCNQKNESLHVQLITGSEPPTPATTFELRFESIMVRGDRVGLIDTNPPLLVRPLLAGTYTWLSSRSGVYTPTEPLALDTRYELSLRPGLACADGQPSDAALHWSVKTPSFGVITAWPQHADANAGSQPEIKLAFNADVQAADAGRLIYFCDAAGNQVPTDVRQGVLDELWSNYDYYSGSLHTWKQDAAALGRSGAPTNQAAAPLSPTNEVPNLLVATPQQPLPIGKGWKLVVRSGIPSADGALQTREPDQVPIGDVTPFVVQDVEAHNYLNAGPSIQIEFSKPVPDSLTNDFRNWIQMNQDPTNLEVWVHGRQLTFYGDFAGGSSLSLKFQRGLPSTEPFALKDSPSFELDVPHIAPRLYFPALSRDQLAGGHRSFPLLTVNVAHVRIRAKLMDPPTAIHALRAYGSYFATSEQRQASDDGNEPYRAIDYNVLPGTTVFDKEFDLGAAAHDSDAANRLDLKWDQLLNGRRTGVVFLDARALDDDQNPALGTQALIQLTDLGMIWKKSAAGIDVFVFSHGSGRPAAGATTRLMSGENQLLRETVTDTNGLAHLAAATNAEWVAVQAGDDFHAVTLDQDRIWRNDFALPSTGSDESEDPRRVMMFSDRDLYRPGESMHFEAIVRDWDDRGLRIPPYLTGTLACTDARDKVFFQTNAVFSSLGSWSALVPLPVGSRGAYAAQLRLGTNDYDYGFQVRDFKPSAFEITLPTREAYAAGQPVELPLSAHYLFGKKLSRAQVVWSFQADDLDFRPEKFTAFTFHRTDVESGSDRGRSSLTLTGRGMLTGPSNFIIAPKILANPIAPQPRAVSLLVEVTDVNQQTLSRRAEFVCHSSDFYLGMRQAADVLDSNTPPALEVLALRADGRPWPDTVPAHLTLQRVDWQPIRVQGAGRSIRYHNEPIFTNILEKEITVAPIAEPRAPEDEAKGNPITDIPPLPAGEYLAEVTTADAGRRPVISSLDFQVSAPAEMGWNYRNDVHLALKPNQTEYQPGDTAELLIEAPFSGTALVTIEREKVLRSFVTELDGNAPSVRVPLQAADVPNVFVSVTLLRGSDQSPHTVKQPEYRIGSCELPVTDPRNRLTVETVPLQTNNLPGHPVEASVRVTDAEHQPVRGAEVVLYAVDDGILGLTGYTLPDPYGFFYAARPLAVLTSISLPNLITEDPDELRFQNKGYLGGGGGREQMRKNFLACAFWNATLLTDADGKIEARFTAPDSLTRYHLFAVAHTADSHFGSGQSAFRVTKPLIIEPALPSFANITDHLTARGVILNQTTNAGDVLVSLALDDKARAAGNDPALTRRLSLSANGSAVVEFPVEFTDTGESKWVWRAHFADPAKSDFTDAVQSTLAVGHIAPVIGEVLLSRVTTSQTNLLALANPQLLAGRGTITVNVANTRLNELGETVSQLLHYPYGCAEQTGSSLLPWLVLRDTPGLLPDRLGAKTNEAPAAIRSGITRLFSMQTPSGGLGYWPHSKEPMFWASAYGGLVLAIAQRQGVSLPKDDFDSLLNYLSEQLRSSDDDPTELSDQCLALYALAVAGRAEPAYHERLYGLRAKLATEDRALLALAIAESHGPADLIADLLHPASTRMTVEGRFGCLPREEAIRLLAWIHYQPADPAVDRLVTSLMHEQKQAHWETTQGDAWALLALTEYARLVETKLQPAAGQLCFGQQSIPFQLNDHTNVFSQSFVLSNLADTAVSLLNASNSCLYTTISIEARPPEQPQPRQDRGLSLQRLYQRLDDDNQPQELTGLRVGDRVLVTLRLNIPDLASYVVIDDALPSVLEAINPEFRTQEGRPSGLAEDESGWISDFREIRQDRCLYFADEVEPGTYVLRYVARVRAAGSVTAPPAKAEEMYQPEVCGFTESQTIVSEAMK